MPLPKKGLVKEGSCSSSMQRSIFNTNVKNVDEMKALTTCSPKELKEKLDKNNKLLENEEIISKLADKGQKLRERNKLISELLQKHESNLSTSTSELENLISKMNICEEGAKQTCVMSKITPVSLGNKKKGRFYNPSAKANQISIEESIKLQECQERLQQEIRIHALSEKFQHKTVDKKDLGSKTTHYDDISEGSYDSDSSDEDEDEDDNDDQ
ncbi:3898_t:CDS:2 [Funneliformis caledonium]|uniref:3898_t:CDS:1 n=1 Tax=Funneliformis caledonium TaxID=1117310 RepID=A0A9N9ATT3_9GLOM|nr:3898_t:CDS:2 [Funneliformis caledonium]